MNLEQKIDQIRRMPEHIRIRYAWMLAGGITLLIIVVWIITFLSQTPEIPEEVVTEDSDILENIDLQKNSIKNAADGMKKSLESNKSNVGAIGQ